MLIGILLGILAAIFSIVFWVQLIMAIYNKVKKQTSVKPHAIKAAVFACLFFVSGITSVVFMCSALVKGDPLVNSIAEGIGEASSNIAEHTYEGVQSGWNKALVEKVDALQVSFSSIRKLNSDEITEDDSLSFTNGTDVSKDKNIYEITLLVTNPLAKSKKIPYRKLIRQQLVYALDTNDSYLQSYVVDESGIATIPFILTFLLPSYRRNQTALYVPQGKSKLLIRLDAKQRNDIKEIMIGNKAVMIPSENSAVISEKL